MQHEERFPVRELDWAEHAILVNRIVLALDQRSFRPDAIIAVARGGMVTATMLSHRIGCRNVGVIRYVRTSSDRPQILDPGGGSLRGLLLPDGSPQRILLVDDIVACGTTLSECRRILRESYRDASVFAVTLFRDCNYRDATLTADMWWAAELVEEKWVRFPWEHREDRSDA